MSNAVSDFLADRSAEEKKTLLVHLLRELMQHSPGQPISIEDQSGELVGLFSPVGAIAGGTPTFFRELERRRQANNVVSAEEAALPATQAIRKAGRQEECRFDFPAFLPSLF